jgi:predicted metal-dependent hydrolase
MPPLLPHYTHQINPKLKHTYLSFDREGNLLIKSPGLTQYQLERLLLKKAAWIQRSISKIKKKKGKQCKFDKECQLYYLGNPYPLNLQYRNQKGTKLLFDGAQFTLYYHTYNEIRFHQHIDRFYRTKAESYIPHRVNIWAEKMSLIPHAVHFRKTKRQWGSCSAYNKLSFNTMLMKLPLDTIDYVIVHELAHIQHKHHQKAFWKLVEDTMPFYKEQIVLLKTYTTD